MNVCVCGEGGGRGCLMKGWGERGACWLHDEGEGT